MNKEHQEYLNGLPDGVYLFLGHDDYLKIDRVSNSFLKKMRMSPGDAWKGSPMNPDRERDERKPTDALKLGQAYDVAMLDPDCLDEQFVRGISKTDTDYLQRGILTNGTQIGEKLAGYGLSKSKAGETVLEKAARLKDAGYPGYIWAAEEAKFADRVGRRTVITGKYWDDLKRDVERVHALPEIKELLVGGLSHPVVLWTRDDGIRCKCELDKLFDDKIVDLKSFENTREVPLEQCVRDAIRYRRYYMQAVWYWLACRAIVQFDLEIKDFPASPTSRQNEVGSTGLELISKIKSRGYSLQFYFVFQQKSGVPNCIGRRFKFFNHDMHQESSGMSPADQERLSEKHGFQSTLMMKAFLEINKAIDDYKKYREVYSDGEPWQYLKVVADMDDEEFNEYWLKEET